MSQVLSAWTQINETDKNILLQFPLCCRKETKKEECFAMAANGDGM